MCAARVRFLRGGSTTTVPGSLAVDAGMDSNIRSAVGANVVLIGAELAALSRDALQLLLRRSIGIADIHLHAFYANTSAVILLDHVLTFFASLEAVRILD